MTAPELDGERLRQPLLPMLPLIRELFFEQAMSCGLLAGVSDARGRLLWVDVSARLRPRARELGFCGGADWSEQAVGTTALSLTLRHRRPMQVAGPLHLRSELVGWTSSAHVLQPAAGAPAYAALVLLRAEPAAARLEMSFLASVAAVLSREVGTVLGCAEIEHSSRDGHHTMDGSGTHRSQERP